MNQEMIQRLQCAIQALNNVSVSGEANLMNLGGSIKILKEIFQMMQNEMKTDEQKE